MSSPSANREVPGHPAPIAELGRDIRRRQRKLVDVTSSVTVLLDEAQSVCDDLDASGRRTRDSLWVCALPFLFAFLPFALVLWVWAMSRPQG